MKNSIGRILKQKRVEKGISGSFMARKLGFTRQTLSNKETDKSEFSLTEGAKYCDILGLKVDDVVKEYIFLDQ